MAAHSGSSSSVPSLPPPCPKSPPQYPDLYGKRRELTKVRLLEREICLLEEELETVEGLHPASRCCKEVSDFVVANSDPLIPVSQKNQWSCRFWKSLCGTSCFNFSWLSWICCSCHSKCSIHIELPRCCDSCDCSLCNRDPCTCCSMPSCTCCSMPSCTCCSMPKCWCCFCPRSCPRSRCCRNFSCSRACCNFRFPSCLLSCSCCHWKWRRPKCCHWKWRRPKCPKVRLCCSCKNNCCTCNPCCLFL